MKLLVLLAVLAYASAQLSLTEWKSQYGAFPRGRKILASAPSKIKTMPFVPNVPMYYTMEPKAYTIPKGYRASYDPENFNEVFGFYPDYKK